MALIMTSWGVEVEVETMLGLEDGVEESECTGFIAANGEFERELGLGDWWKRGLNGRNEGCGQWGG